jgi:hypothetical protein
LTFPPSTCKPSLVAPFFYMFTPCTQMYIPEFCHFKSSLSCILPFSYISRFSFHAFPSLKING